MKQVRSLTTGSISKELTLLSLPIVATAFLSTAYNIADMAWVGLLGGEALAGVGIGGMYVWFSQGIAFLSRMGGQVLVGQAIGAGNLEAAEKYASAAIWISNISGALFGLICLIFAAPMSTAFGLESSIAVESCKIYLWIVCGLSIIPFAGFTLTGIYNAQGDSKTPLIANFIGMVLNIILDPIMIFGPGPLPALGILGASSATMISQVVVLIVLIVAAQRDSQFYNVVKGIKLFEKNEKKYFTQVLRLGWPSAIQTMAYCSISMVLTLFTAGFGEIAVAIFRVGNQVESLAWNIANGFGSAINAFTAQNYGAGNMIRVRKGYKFSFAMVIAWGIFVSLLFIIFPAQLSSVFFHTEKEVLLSIDYLVIIGVGEALMCLELLTIGALQGLGKTGICSLISVTLTSARIPIAVVLSATALGLNGIWWSMSLTSMAKGLIFWAVFYIVCRRQEKRIA
ncbi:MAG: MATE family efflux transporter [Clostridiales bacterium]|jgi:putative MATE family efflux protein|nr:MATE family efflux transporter [Clostridiales bacterium]